MNEELRWLSARQKKVPFNVSTDKTIPALTRTDYLFVRVDNEIDGKPSLSGLAINIKEISQSTIVKSDLPQFMVTFHVIAR